MAGKVYLIGAGPGDPGLITVKGSRRLQEADVVVYDRLVDPRLLESASPEAELIFGGKGPGERAMDQEDINRLLVERALDGKVVARLKGGDPFLFGRGGEEALALADAGIAFEVVPGVTSAIAAPAYAGIPVTHRCLASSVTVVSGAEDPSKAGSSIPWDALARSGGTLVVLMGWGALETITEVLTRHGMEPSTPAALVRWGTEPCQVTVTGTLKDIAQRGREAGLSPPLVAVIGPVVDLRRHLRWYDNRPLFGKRVLVTRSRAQASILSEMLAEEGAEPLEVPAIELAPVSDSSHLDSAIASLGSYSWVIFSSVNGVGVFFSRLHDQGLDARALAGVKAAAIGPATAAALAREGIRANCVPPLYESESLVQTMEPLGLEGGRVLLPGSAVGRDVIARGLERLGAVVDQIPVYRTTAATGSREKALDLLRDGKVDLVTFTSSSTVLNLLELLDGNKALLEGTRIACIGPVTAGTARGNSLRVDIVAQEYTIAGLVRAVKEHFSS